MLQACFSGEVEVGKVSEAQGAFIRVFFSLNVIVARLQSLTAFGAGIDRLYDFSDAISDVESPDVIEEESSEPLLVLAASLEIDTVSEEDTVSTDTTEERSEQPDTEESPSVIALEISPTLALDNLTLQTPNYQRTLIENLSLTLRRKDRCW